MKFKEGMTITVKLKKKHCTWGYVPDMAPLLKEFKRGKIEEVKENLHQNKAGKYILIIQFDEVKYYSYSEEDLLFAPRKNVQPEWL